MRSKESKNAETARDEGVTSTDLLCPKQPKIITLCGSTRFIETIAVMGYLLEKEGAIVLGLHFLPQSYFKVEGVVESHIAEKEGVAEHFDNLHLRKIDISDSIYVVNIDGYIGKSTRNEINYAEKIGKSVSYLEPIS